MNRYHPEIMYKSAGGIIWFLSALSVHLDETLRGWKIAIRRQKM